jgi:phosphoserine phosphatase RsbU/P
VGAHEAPVVRMTGPGRRPALGAVGGAALVAVIAVADLLAPPWLVFIGLTVLGPLLASLAASWLQTAAVAVFALVTALLLGLANGMFLSEDHLIRLVLVGVGGALCVYAAGQRERRQAAMSRLAHVAEVAQEVMLRPPPAVLGHVALAGRYVSASDEALVGGDLYETAYTPRGVRVIVGDVRGKGLDGIRLAASVLATFRETVWEGDLTDLARAIDKRLTAETADEDFVTAVLAEFPPDGGVMLLNCGHLAPLWLRGGRADPLVPAEPSPPFGLDPEPRTERHEFTRRPAAALHRRPHRRPRRPGQLLPRRAPHRRAAAPGAAARRRRTARPAACAHR